jgi:hypothetical protein
VTGLDRYEYALAPSFQDGDAGDDAVVQGEPDAAALDGKAEPLDGMRTETSPEDARSPLDANVVDVSLDRANGEAASTCVPFLLPPSVNVDAIEWASRFATSPVWNCNSAGTTTVDSAAGTVTSTSCSVGLVDLTNDVAQTVPGGPPVMVLRLRGLSVSNGHKMKISGDKPVVFLVAGDVVVDSGGLIDASAVGATPGPGGDAPGGSSGWCAGSTGSAGLFSSAAAGSAGGGGGAFGTSGGRGGGDNLSPPGGTAGAPAAGSGLQPLRGGCAGGPGGSAPQGSAGASGGAGGGAFEISASGTITIGTGANPATLSAAGGGSPAPGRSGGMNVYGYFVNASGGGGSGGGVLLVAPASPAATFGAAGALRVHGGGAAGSYVSQTATDPPATAGGDGHIADDEPASGGTGSGSGLGGPYYRDGGAGGLTSAGATDAVGPGAAGSGNYGSTGGGGGGGRAGLVTAASTPVCN